MKKLYFFTLIILSFLCFSGQAQTAGETYTYDFGDGTVFPQDGTTYDNFDTSDGIVSMNRGTGSQFYYNDATHGVAFKNANYFVIAVAGNATITFTTCQYSPDGGTLTFTDADDNVLGVIDSDINGGVDGTDFSFNYEGPAGSITATLSTSGSNYIHGMSISNFPDVNPGDMFTYPFGDGTVFPQNATTYDNFATSDGVISMHRGTGSQFYYNDATHGVAFKNANYFVIAVAGNATITFTTCQYSPDGGTLTFTDANENVLGVIDSDINGGTDGTDFSFNYVGGAGYITATLATSGSNYIHGMSIANDPEVVSNGLIDVWDFGAEQLDEMIYNNKLTESDINAWYDGSITPGSTGVVLPSTWTAGALSWTGGTNDRLRTTNTNLTRYDTNIASSVNFTGRLYVNSGANPSRYLSFTLSEDDEVTIEARSDAGGTLNFQYVADPDAQTDQVAIPAAEITVDFVAKSAGVYHVFDTTGKPSYFRIYRKDATYITVSGNVDETLAPGIPDGYSIIFTNEAGKDFTVVVSSGTYSIDLPAGYTYSLSLQDANGYIITNGASLAVDESTTTHDVEVSAIETYNVTGNITGLSDLSNLNLNYTPDPVANTLYIPIVTIDAMAGTYSVDLEPSIEYTISADGVNDYEILANTITIGTAPETADVVFSLKPVYNVTINTIGLDMTQQDDLNLTFNNLYEEGYSYSFTDINTVALRDGTYTVSYDGIDAYPIRLALTSNLTVNGTDTSKDLTFEPAREWEFRSRIINGATAYEGLLFTGSVNVRGGNGDLNAGAGSTISIPVMVGDKVIITDYYTSNYSVEGGPVVTNTSNSTSVNVVYEYVYPGASDGTVTISVNATSYFVKIKVISIVPYNPIITVGVDKDYQTINEALDAISRMDRPSDEPVTVMIDPGNYEEMLVIESNNITLKNASPSPSIAILNQGVDIDPNAVRVTSYYGQKYNFFSQGTDNKWSAEALAVNIENGYTTYVNQEGTGNGSSYWNATIVVKADDFTAEDLIIENSFNQYISLKESQDVVVRKATSEPVRPTDYGNTAVQNRALGYVTQAAAIGIAASADRVLLDECRVIGRQDTFYGAQGARVAIFRGVMMGAVDYLFGGMTAVFYQSDLVHNTSDSGSDAAYITAAQQTSGRGFLMYECHVKSPLEGVETASTYGAKPGYFGRPWAPNTSEVVFYNTTIDESTYPGSEGLSLIAPAGWTSSLGGESPMMYEYGTIENSGEDNSGVRAPWSTVLGSPTLTDGTAINTFNFTMGTDNWDPFQDLLSVDNPGYLESSVVVKAYAHKLYILNVTANTQVNVYAITGALVKTFETDTDTAVYLANGLYIVKVKDQGTSKTVKLIAH